MMSYTSTLVKKAQALPLWCKILIGMLAGIIVGIIVGPKIAVIRPIGDLFINAIKMLIVPLVFTSLVVGVTSIQDSSKMGRISIKAIVIYLSTTALAVSFGLLMGNLLKPGAGLDLAIPANQVAAKAAPSFIDTLINIIPSNPIASLSSGHILQIIVFAILLGIAINLIPKQAEPLTKVFNAGAEVMYKLTGIIMALAPYGIFALMAWLAGTQGIQVLLPLLKLVFAVYLTALIHMFIVYGGIIKLFTRFSPVQFFKRILDVILFSYSTSSSSATLPVSMRCAQEKLGISKSITSFVLPLGATINMNGTAIYQGICALFIAQVYGIPLSGTEYSLIIATTVLAAIGTAGVPGAGLIMLSLVLTSAGLPLAGIALIAGIDRILDMARSSVNVVGDIVASLLIAKSEGELKHMPDISSSTAEETEKPVSTSAQL